MTKKHKPIIHDERTKHVIFALRYNDHTCMITITIPNVPPSHNVTVGEAIMNLDPLFANTKQLECLATDGQVILIPLSSEIPKSSQIVMLAHNIIVLSDAEYREYMSGVWGEGEVPSHTHQCPHSVN
ncbi:TPA: hypothetical protein NGR52_004180 [Vibrio parahaemolyticus]|nr:hypothetical protein [Vibrio parahaemolyticus]